MAHIRDDFKKKIRKNLGTFLRCLAEDEEASLFPLRVSVKQFIDAARKSSLSELKNTVEEINTSFSGLAKLEYATINTKGMGTQTLPQAIVLAEAAFLTICGETKTVASIRRLRELTGREVPSLKEAMRDAKFLSLMADNEDIWPEILKITKFMCEEYDLEQPLHARALPIDLSTKFTEGKAKLLTKIWDRALPADKINHEALSFEGRFGFKEKVPTVLIRILDPELAVKLFNVEITEVQLPCEQAAMMAEVIPVDATVLMVENKKVLLDLPHMKNTIAIMGSGFNASGIIKSIGWIRTAASVFYWGDIDSHGIEILGHVRSHIPEVTALMMDTDTLDMFYKYVDGNRPKSSAEHFVTLSSEEELIHKRMNTNLESLEQEKIPQFHVTRVLRTKMGNLLE